MDEKTVSPIEPTEELESYEAESLLKSKNPRRTKAKVGRPALPEDDKLEAQAISREKFNAKRRDARRRASEELEKEKAEAYLKSVEAKKQAEEEREEEIFQRKLKQREEKARAKAEVDAKKHAAELEKAEKEALIKRVKELEAMQAKQVSEPPPPMQTLARPARPKITRLYL